MSQLKQWLNPRSSAAKMAVLFVICSVIFYLATNTVGPWVALIPHDVVHELKLWQVVTYGLVFQRSPGSFIFGCLIIVSIGGVLEAQWGAKRLWLFTFTVVTLAGVLTALLGLVFPAIAEFPFVGADAAYQSMWVAYGLMMGRNRTNFWGVLPVTGYTLAMIGAAFVVLTGLTSSWLVVIPELIALALTFLHIHYKFPHEALTRFGSWRLQRDLNKRASHLRVITGDDRNTPRDSDKYLH